MSSQSQSVEIMDSLRVQLTNGEGKKVFDSQDKIPDIGFPKEPLKFCPACGGETQPIIYQCKCCGQRFVQQEDRKTHRKLVIALPREEPQETIHADPSVI